MSTTLLPTTRSTLVATPEVADAPSTVNEPPARLCVGVMDTWLTELPTEAAYAVPTRLNVGESAAEDTAKADSELLRAIVAKDALRIPEPQVLNVFIGSQSAPLKDPTELIRMSPTSCGDNVESIDLSNAATPATNGAEKLVPEAEAIPLVALVGV